MKTKGKMGGDKSCVIFTMIGSLSRVSELETRGRKICTGAWQWMKSNPGERAQRDGSSHCG